MDDFLKKYQNQITGYISTFDRIIFKGYLPISYPESAERFFSYHKMLLKEFKEFTKEQTEILKVHAQQIAKQSNRPYEYIRGYVRKEDYARKIAERDKITEGLICVLAVNEENHTFALRYGKTRPHLTRCSPRCLTLYFYYMDKHFGFMHVRLSTWMPWTIQIYINGHDWLACQMKSREIPFQQIENAFISIDNCAKAQNIADRFPTLPWEKLLHVFARRVNPLQKTILSGMEYYWVIDQAEYATDIMFNHHSVLDELYLNWQKHAAVCTQAEDVMRFMGRRLHGSFNSVIQTDFKYRPEVTRIKHTVRGNWIKMYNKHGIVLRVETVINRPKEFRIYRISRGEKPGYWAPMPKRISSMKRYAQISFNANSSYLQALAQVDDTRTVQQQLTRLCEPQKLAKRRVRGLNLFRKKDYVLFEAVIRGEHFIQGFRASEFAIRLGMPIITDLQERKRQCAKINRLLRLLRGHALIARIPHTKRYRITDLGMRLMNTIIDLKTNELPQMLKQAA